MSNQQSTVVKIVIGAVAAAVLLFVGLPCCVSGYMLIKFRQAEAEKQLKEAERRERQLQRPPR